MIFLNGEYIFIFQTSGNFTDAHLSKAFSRAKANFSNRQKLKEAFADIQELITQTVRNCADNIKVIIYMDEVLDDPVITTVGQGENKLLITLDSDNGVDFTWTEETLAKAFWDGWDSGKKIAENVTECIASKLMKE